MFDQPATLTIEIPAGATVKQALLYWEGLMFTDEVGDGTIEVSV